MSSRPIVIISRIDTAPIGRATPVPASAQAVSSPCSEAVSGSHGIRQAVAAARLGASVLTVGRVSDNDSGRRVMADMKAEGVDCTYLRAAAATELGLQTADIDAAEDAVARAAVCLLNSELPVEILEHTIGLCRGHEVETLLNVASLAEGEVPASLFQVDVICCGENEAARLTGLSAAKSPRAVAASLAKRGCRSVVLKLGRHGAYAFSPEGESAVPGFAVPVVDTTTAGDAFTAALAVTRAWGWQLTQALRLANAASALASARPPALTAMPTLSEVESLLASQL